MSTFTKTNWQDGDILDAAGLNHIEDGVLEALSIQENSTTVDTTLSIAHAAADAQTVGDILSNLIGDVYSQLFLPTTAIPLTWISGGFSNINDDPPESTNTSNTRLHTTIETNQSKLILYCPAGFQFTYSIYFNDNKQSAQTTWSTDYKTIFNYGEGTYKLYLNIGYTNNNSITTSDLIKIIVAYEEIDDFNAETKTVFIKKNLFNRFDKNTLRGYYDRSNTWIAANDLGQTDFIKVDENKKYYTAYPSVPVLWFDENQTFLGATSSSDNKLGAALQPLAQSMYAKFIFEKQKVNSFFVYSDSEKDIMLAPKIRNFYEKNPYYNKKGVAFGTSLTYRSGYTYPGSYVQSGKSRTGGYLEFLPIMSQILFDNQGMGNSTIIRNDQHMDGDSYLDMMEMIENYFSSNLATDIYNEHLSKEIILLEGFVNDWYDNSDKLGEWTDLIPTLGTWHDIDPQDDTKIIGDSYSVCAAVRYAINFIKSKIPYSTIIVILDHYGQAVTGNQGCASTVKHTNLTQYEFYEEISKVCESLGVPVIKGYAISGINEYTPNFFRADNDIIHLSPDGAKHFADVIWAEMQRFYPLT